MTRSIVRADGIYVTLAVQVFNFLLIFLGLELGVRLFLSHITPININAETLVTDQEQAPFFKRHPFAAFTWIPYARFQRQTVNSQGFVSTREIPMQRMEGELRIVTLGGSSTVGNGNLDQQTYPRELERLLQERLPGRTVNVINAAAGGYSTIESLGYLQTRMLHWRPDIVLIMHAWNDMYYFTLSDEEISRWREGFNLQAMWNPKVAVKMQDPMPAHVQYLSWSQLYLHLWEWGRQNALTGIEGNVALEQRFDHVKKLEGGGYKIDFKRPNAAALALYGTNLQQISHLCKQWGISCYSILQPTLLSEVADRTSPKIQQAEQTAGLYHAFGFDTHVDVFREMYRINREVFGERIIDATIMNAEEGYFLDHIHQNADGTRVLAELALENLLPTLKSL